jgi:hypothetical protein
MLPHRKQDMPRLGHVEDAIVTRRVDVPWAKVASVLSTPDPPSGGNKIRLRDDEAFRWTR